MPPRQPTRPTFGWDNLTGGHEAGLPAVDDLPHTRLLTSGRAALFAAMQALGVQPGDTVLAPSYHCPTLVAPLRAAGATVQFYPLDAEGLPLTPDPVPEENYFVRSDHYSFVKAGVPSIYLDAGPAGAGKAATDAFMANHYHQVSDQTDLPIDWTAARRFMAIHYRLARDVADADARPRWTRGDFFGVLFGGYGAK